MKTYYGKRCPVTIRPGREKNLPGSWPHKLPKGFASLNRPIKICKRDCEPGDTSRKTGEIEATTRAEWNPQGGHWGWSAGVPFGVFVVFVRFGSSGLWATLIMRLNLWPTSFYFPRRKPQCVKWTMLISKLEVPGTSSLTRY